MAVPKQQQNQQEIILQKRAMPHLQHSKNQYVTQRYEKINLTHSKNTGDPPADYFSASCFSFLRLYFSMY